MLTRVDEIRDTKVHDKTTNSLGRGRQRNCLRSHHRARSLTENGECHCANSQEIDEGIDDSASGLHPLRSIRRHDVHDADNEEEQGQGGHAGQEHLAAAAGLDDEPADYVSQDTTSCHANTEVEGFGDVEAGELKEVCRVS